MNTTLRPRCGFTTRQHVRCKRLATIPAERLPARCWQHDPDVGAVVLALHRCGETWRLWRTEAA